MASCSNLAEIARRAGGVAALLLWAACAIAAEQAAMDDRQALHLTPRMAAHQKANMRHHLEAVQTVVTALAADDYDRVAQAARSMGAAPDTLRMCRHMGEGNPPDFTERAVAFHESADRIAAAAASHDRGRVLTALSDTLAACTGCHAIYRQEVDGGTPHGGTAP